MGDPVIAAIIAACAGLTGAVLGGCLSWLGAYLNDRRSWRRADRRRFETERREVYAKFLGCVARLNARDNRSQRDDALVAEWMGCLSEIEIIASSEVREGAMGFAKIANEILFSPNNSLPVDAWYNSRQAFLSAVRKELGVPVWDYYWALSFYFFTITTGVPAMKQEIQLNSGAKVVTEIMEHDDGNGVSEFVVQ
jgi:hypothetical protein